MLYFDELNIFLNIVIQNFSLKDQYLLFSSQANLLTLINYLLITPVHS